MKFEWHEAKRLANIQKHNIDFRDAVAIWKCAVINPFAVAVVEGEIRPTALGVIGDDATIIAVVYTRRSGVIRIICARRARRDERKTYQSHFGYGI